MDKKTFIRELEQALSVLEEEELQDILSEYEQHIDMKQEKGLTEEEAIADFGSMDELTAEILEAYHVRADYAAEKRNRKRGFLLEKRKDFSGKRVPGGRLLAFILAGIKRMGRAAWNTILSWREWGEGLWHRLFKSRADGQNNDYPDEIEHEEKEEGAHGRKEEMGRRDTEPKAEMAAAARGRTGRSLPGRGEAGRGIQALFQGFAALLAHVIRLCLQTALWSIRMMWNAGCIGFSFCCGCFGLCCLYGFGLLLVLLLQGYPLAGFTLGCFGLVMCSFSAAWLGLTLVWRARGAAEDETKGTGRGDKRDPETKAALWKDAAYSQDTYREMKGGQGA